jgi:hypothetical protein
MYRWTTVRRVAALVRGGWGVALLTAPEPILAAFGHRGPRPAVMVARLLGARQVIQATVTAAAPTRLVVIGGALADALHALTGVGLAVAAPGWRRIAAADAAVASVLSGVGWVLAEPAGGRGEQS